MKPRKVLIALLGILLFATSVSAKTMYVNDLIKLMLRSGRGLDNRILAIIESGDVVEMLKPGEQWSKVRIADGKEGWVLSRYLTDKETASRQLAKLQKTYADTVVETEALRSENERLKDENDTVSKALEQKKTEYDSLSNTYETLKRESAEFLRLKKQFTKASTEMNELQQQNQQFKASLARLKRNQNIRWFIAGASVLIVGILIGLSSRRKRRKPSLLH